MITCKEDMLGCYAPRCDKEVFELFMDKCDEFGIKWAGRSDEPRDCQFGEAVVFSGTEEDKLTHGSELGMKQKGYKRLTLSDLKPRTKVEYELIKFESTADAYRTMLDGEKLYSQDGESEFLFDGKNFVGIDSDGGVYTLECHSDNEPFYRKVERPVEWWDDAVEYLNSNCKGVTAAGYCVDTNSIAITGHMNQEQCYDFARILLEQEGE